MNNTIPGDVSWMPTRAAAYLARQTARLIKAGSLTPDHGQQVYRFLGVRPNASQWRAFLVPLLALLGLLSLVAGALFFIAWNWAQMPKMAKFALAELLIVALAVIVWWRWYQSLARSALLAAGLSFGALFALYGQIYQTGANSWELFRAWLYILVPLALIARQDSLWFCSWLVANLAFHLYYVTLSATFMDSLMFNHFGWLPETAMYAYLLVLTLCLVLRETLAQRALAADPQSWLASRWFSYIMAGFLLLLLTMIAAGNIASIVMGNFSEWNERFYTSLITGFWLITLLVGYYLYRYRFPDLGMLTLGIVSLAVTGCTLIADLFSNSWETGDLFAVGCLMALWLAANGALLLHWRRTLYERDPVDVSSSELNGLITALRQHDLLSSPQVQELQLHDHTSELPWYLRLALGLGSWVSALIVLLLLALILYMTGLLDEPNAVVFIVPSLIFAALASVLLRAAGAGKNHIGLAWAIAATGGLCVGLYLFVDPDWESSFLVVALCTLPVLMVMAIVMPDRTYRFMAITAMTFLAVLLANDLTSRYLSPVTGYGLFSALVAGLVAFWLWMVREQLRLQATPMADAVLPIIYGIAAGLVIVSFTAINAGWIADIFWNTSPFFSLQSGTGMGIAAGLTLSALYLFFTQKTPLPLLAAILCGGAAIYAPGIGLGLTLLMMARFQGSRGILGIAFCLLLLYVSCWYYFLGVNLLHKSVLLLIGGGVLLAVAFAAKKALPTRSGSVYENQ